MHNAEVMTDLVDRDVQDDGVGLWFACVCSPAAPGSDRVYESQRNGVIEGKAKTRQSVRKHHDEVKLLRPEIERCAEVIEQAVARNEFAVAVWIKGDLIIVVVPDAWQISLEKVWVARCQLAVVTCRSAVILHSVKS